MEKKQNEKLKELFFLLLFDLCGSGRAVDDDMPGLFVSEEESVDGQQTRRRVKRRDKTEGFHRSTEKKKKSGGDTHASPNSTAVFAPYPLWQKSRLRKEGESLFLCFFGWTLDKNKQCSLEAKFLLSCLAVEIQTGIIGNRGDREQGTGSRVLTTPQPTPSNGTTAPDWSALFGARVR